jgi:phosphoesterase RecJ-like protein
MTSAPSDPCLRVLEALSNKHRVLVVTHARPDGDALGAATAMVLALRYKGIDSHLLLFNPPSPKYGFILHENHIPHFDIENGWPSSVDLQSFDAMVVVDTGTWSQLPGLKELLSTTTFPKIVVDHHLTQEDWADVKWVVTSAAAAGEIVADLLDAWDVPIDKPIATALFLAISTDTGWFQFSNTTPKTLRLAARLIETGVDTERIYRLTYQNERPQRLAILSRAMQSLELLADNRLAVMSLSRNDFQQTGADGADAENIVNIPLQVATVEVAVLLTEQPNGEPVRVNLRSKGALDVAAFAQRFKGGGHARAAGLKLDGDLSTARRTISAALLAALTP